MSKRNKNKVLTKTPRKIIIRYGELVGILTEEEIWHWHNILDKIRKHDELNNNNQT